MAGEKMKLFMNLIMFVNSLSEHPAMWRSKDWISGQLYAMLTRAQSKLWLVAVKTLDLEQFE
jgi:hypothetical protein